MKLINFELNSIQPLALLLGNSGSIYLSVNTTTDCGRSLQWTQKKLTN